jgi:hypothetical protein
MPDFGLQNRCAHCAHNRSTSEIAFSTVVLYFEQFIMQYAERETFQTGV